MKLDFNDIQGLNEAMLEIVQAAAEQEKLSVPGIFYELFTRKNVVSDYMRSYIDPALVALDFKKLADSVEADSKVTSDALDLIRRTTSGNDRFTNELSFMINAIGSGARSSGLIKDTLSKYVNISYMFEDLKNMLPAAPIQNWEKSSGTILDAFGKNLTALAAKGELDPVLSRDQEIQRMVQILIRKTKSNPILVGKPGTGKTAIVEGLALVLNSGTGIPIMLSNSKLYQLNMAAILAAGAQPGELEKIMEQLVVVATQEDAILFIDEVHIIMENNARLANALKPAMARGDIRLIGATTEAEYKSAFDKDEAMQRRFQPVRIDESNKTSVYRILQQKAHQMEEYHNVLVPNVTLLQAIALSEKFIPDRQQPDKAIDLIEEAASKLRMTLESKPEIMVELQDDIGEKEIQYEMVMVKAGDELTEREAKNISKLGKDIKKLKKEYKRLDKEYQKQKLGIDHLIALKNQRIEYTEQAEQKMHLGEFKAHLDLMEQVAELSNEIIAGEIKIQKEHSDEDLIGNIVQPDMVARVIEVWTGIPASAQSEDDLEKYRNIEVELKKEVHGQDRPIELISAAIKRSKAGLAEANKPLGSFLCLGPTGVGKTYLAQKLAEFMFDTDKVLKRYDMSEYMEPHSVAKLFGSPPGYVGYAEGGQLTEDVRRNPYSIILFDEIEKAHPKVFDALLQVLDAGRLTDGQGHTVDFKNTIIIMTSNTGSAVIQEGIKRGLEPEVIERALMEEIQNHFRPEFLNRFDAKVMFNSLKLEDVVMIAESELKKFQDKLYQENEIDLYWNPIVAAGIAIVANDPMNGARPIKRFINDRIVNQLTTMLLNSEIAPGGTVYLDLFGEEFVMTTITTKELKEIKKNQKKINAMDMVKDLDIQEKPKDTPDLRKVQETDIVDADVDDADDNESEFNINVESTDINSDEIAKSEFPETEKGD